MPPLINSSILLNTISDFELHNSLFTSKQCNKVQRAADMQNFIAEKGSVILLGKLCGTLKPKD